MNTQTLKGIVENIDFRIQPENGQNFEDFWTSFFIIYFVKIEAKLCISAQNYISLRHKTENYTLQRGFIVFIGQRKALRSILIGQKAVG